MQDKGWTPLGELTVGDKLISASGETLLVVAKEHHPETVEVYNFEVEQAHTYFVGKTLEQSLLVHNDCSTCGKSGWLPHGLLGMCPQNLQDIKNERGLTGLSAVDGVVTHNNAHVPEMTIEFAKTLPLASQVINTDTLISDEATAGEKFGAAASLMLDFASLLVGPATRISKYDDVFEAAKPTKQVARNTNTMITFAETPTKRLTNTVRETATSMAPIARKASISDEELDILKAGGRVEIPARFQQIRLYLCDASAATGNEVMLYRDLTDGKRYIVMGSAAKVSIPKKSRAIAHTHPDGKIDQLSKKDKNSLKDMNQRLHVLIDPYLNQAKMIFGYEGAPSRKF